MTAMRSSLLFILLFAASWSTWAQTSAGSGSGAPPDPAIAHARELLEQGKYDEAIQELQRLSSSQPRARGFDHELGVAYYRKSDYPHAIDSLRKALDEDPQDAEATQLLGISSYLSGKPQEAIPFLEKVQTWYPRANVDASYILGQCYIQTRDYDHARRAFAKMFDLPADSAASYLLAARMLFRQEIEPATIEYAQKAIAIDAKLPRAHLLLGEIHLFKSEIPEAIGDFKSELALNPSDAAAYYKLADAYSRLQKFDEAERLLQRSIWLDPTSTGPYVLMGKVLEKKGEPELAARALRRAAQMDPNNSITHHLLGQAYRELGDQEQAERELKLSGELESAQNRNNDRNNDAKQ